MICLSRSKTLFAALFALAVTWGAAQPASALCIFSCNYTKTKYPIVLAHGAVGFDQALGAVDYFYGIVHGLERSGAEVYVTQVSPFDSVEARGEDLLAQVEEILAISGAEKVNLIGHSQGGMDARYVAAALPGKIASITTVGAPHTGSGPFSVLDSVLEDAGDSPVVGFLNEALEAVYELISEGDLSVDLAASAQSLSYGGAAAFNADYPVGLPGEACGQGPAEAEGMRLYSWGGTGLLTNVLDLTDVLHVVLGPLNDGESDGFTERCASHFGTVIRDDYNQNHLDQVNQLLGLTAPFAADPVTLYRVHANRLKKAGL